MAGKPFVVGSRQGEFSSDASKGLRAGKVGEALLGLGRSVGSHFQHTRTVWGSFVFGFAVIVGTLPCVAADDEKPELLYRTPRTSVAGCGIDALYVCIRDAGYTDVDLKSLEKLLPIEPRGVSLEALARACSAKGIICTPFRYDATHLFDYGCPTVLHASPVHYIALLRKSGSQVWLFDSNVGLVRCPIDIVRRAYTLDGTALAIGFPSPSLWLALHGYRVSIVLGSIVILCIGCRVLWPRRRADLNVPPKTTTVP